MLNTILDNQKGPKLFLTDKTKNKIKMSNIYYFNY
jgi:hypothetical protein